MGFFEKLVAGLGKTRDNIVSGMDSIFHGFSRIDDDFYEELEEVLIMGDLGVQATYDILDDLKAKVKEKHIKEPMECRELLIESIKEQMDIGETAYEFENRTSVVMVIGVNGVGKTTTIGKLAGKLRAENKKVVIAAADTFRAAAGEQLKEWADRAGVDIVSGKEGSDPGSVLFDAISSAKNKGADILLCDTAGRLHNKKNLMEELKKLDRIIEKEYGIPLTEDLRKDVNVMCNLSQGIVDDTEMKIVINMYKNNFTLEQISLATKKSIAEIERIINENSIALPQK